MSSGNPLQQSYTVAIPVYEGPLDLLLQLIERAELDITKIALAQVTDQFLEHLHQMHVSTAGDVSSFLIVASKLVQIKSEALLPRPPVREQGEEDPGDALARQLIIYKRFKEIANFLLERQEKLHTYPRIAPLPMMEPYLDMSGLTIEDIFLAAEFILTQEIEIPSLNSVVSAPKYTIREKIFHIAEYIKKNMQGNFSHLLEEHTSRLEVVVTFLALLELVKRNMVDAHQEGLFGEISIMPANAWADDLAFELEFGE
jgi:segregation and condensation protein A